MLLRQLIGLAAGVALAIGIVAAWPREAPVVTRAAPSPPQTFAEPGRTITLSSSETLRELRFPDPDIPAADLVCYLYVNTDLHTSQVFCPR